MAISTECCNSIHLTNAVEINGEVSLIDIFLNGVVGIRIVHDDTKKYLTVVFNNERTMKLAQKHTHWPRSTKEDNTLLATMDEKGIVVSNLYYRDFELLSNLSEGPIKI